MDLILIAGPQAVGKMTVGKELEKITEAKLLFNHETIDLFARFLGYTTDTFRLSDLVRKELFEAFVKNHHTNVTEAIIFTVVVGFDIENEWSILEEWTNLFIEKEGNVYFVELEADIEIRLQRNTQEDRLKAKPSKRDKVFSRNELLTSAQAHRLNSYEGEVEMRLPNVYYLRLNNKHISPFDAAEKIKQWMVYQGY